MKIVQSLWSKPAISSGGLLNHTGNWKTKYHQWLSWILSTNLAYKNYGNVELVADKEGASILIDKLGLPFTSTQIKLDNLNADPCVWASGKIMAYGLQENPFYHIDADVYLWKKLAIDETASVITQSIEAAPGHFAFDSIYTFNSQKIIDNIPEKPKCFDRIEDKIAYNCGFIGGNNIEFFKKYSEIVMKFITSDKNKAGWHKISDGWVTVVVEQQMLYCVAKEYDVKIETLFPRGNYGTDDVTGNLGYTHLVGNGKSSHNILKRLESRVEQEYPEYFAKVRNLYPSVYFHTQRSVPPPPPPASLVNGRIITR